MVEHGDGIGVHGVGEPVRHEDDGFVLGQLVHGAHDEPFAFGIHTARGLVEDHDRRVMQQRARHGDALALAAGKIRRILFDAHVESLRMGIHHIEHMGACERIAQFALQGAGARHQQILAQRACEEVAARADDRDGAGERAFAQVAHFHGADAQRAGIPLKFACDERGERGFARPGFTDDRGERTRGHRQRDVAQRRRVGPGIGESQAARRHIEHTLRQLTVAICTVRLIQQREDALGGGHAVHRHMEIRAKLAQWQEEVYRDKDHEQHSRHTERRPVEHMQERRRRGECGVPLVHILPERGADAGRGTAVRHHVHRGERTQLDLQHAHRHHAEVLGVPVHLFSGACVGVKGLQRFEPLQVVEEHRPHVGVLAPVLFERLRRGHSDGAHDHDDERRTDEQHHSGGHVERGDRRKQRERREDRKTELRQEQLEETLDLVHAFAGELHHVGSARVLRVRGAEAQHFAVEFRTQAELHALGGLSAEPRGEMVRQEPHDGDGERGDTDQHETGRPGDADGLQRVTHSRLREQRRDEHSHGAGERDIRHKSNPQADDLAHHESAYAGHEREQPFVYHCASFPSKRSIFRTSW